MKIGLNAQKLTDPNPAGPEQFTFNIYNALSKIDHDNKYVVYFREHPGENIWSKISNGNKNWSYKVLPTQISWTHLWLPLNILIDRIDCYYSPVHTLPIIKPLGTKFVVMIHGLEHKTNKELQPGTLKYILTETFLLLSLINANKIMVPSKNTFNAVKDFYKRSINKMVVIPEGVSELFSKKNYPECKDILDKFDLVDKKYVTFIGTVQPRKNLVATIKAFSQALLPGSEFIIIGKPGWNYDDILEAPEKYKVEDKVKFLGYIDDELKSKILARSKAYINFSSDEGFGLTVLEALACGVPCGLSDIPVHREVAKDCAFYANPNDIRDITNVITKTYEVDALNTEDAKKIVAEFSWEKSAEKLLRLFEEL